MEGVEKRLCRSRMLNGRLTENIYKCFSRCLDDSDDELIRDRFSTLFYKRNFCYLFTLVFIPAASIAVAGYIYGIIYLYGVAGSFFSLILLWRFFYRAYVRRAAYTFVKSVVNFETCLNSLFTAIREREIISFGVLANSGVDFRCCNRLLRIELLGQIRHLVKQYTNASERIAVGEEKEKLLHRFFTDSMNELAVSEDINDHILHLSALRDLSKLLSLVRSEYIRLVLFRVTEAGAYRGMRLFCGLSRFKKQHNRFKKRFSSALQYIFLDDDEDAAKIPPKVAKTEISLTERAAVQLSLALQLLREKNGDKKRDKIVSILSDTIDLLAPRHARQASERRFEEMEEYGGTPPLVKYRDQEVFEGMSEAAESEMPNSKEAFYTKLQKRTPLTHALVSELKTALVARVRRRKSSSSAASADVDVGLKVVFDRSDGDSDNSSSFNDSSLLITSSTEGQSFETTVCNANTTFNFTPTSSDNFNEGLLEAIRLRSNLPGTDYGDSDGD